MKSSYGSKAIFISGKILNGNFLTAEGSQNNTTVGYGFIAGKRNFSLDA
jgi:hypothetical protein